MDELENIKRTLIGYLQAVYRGDIYTERDKNLTNRQMIGHGLSYYLTEILRVEQPATVEKIWFDDVAWEKFELLPRWEIKGNGNLWWGFKSDERAKTFPAGFRCEMKLFKERNDFSLIYRFRFRLGDRDFDLQNQNA